MEILQVIFYKFDVKIMIAYGDFTYCLQIQDSNYHKVYVDFTHTLIISLDTTSFNNHYD